jgi:hypothetical protein
MFVPLQSPPKSSPSDTFMCLLAFVLLAATAVLTPSAESRQRPGSSTPASPSAEKVITVWKVGSPHSGETPDTKVPPDLESSAEELGYKLSIESFSAKGFAQTLFDAFANNQEPDILAVNNDGIINGITTPLGSFTGIGSNAKIRQSLMKVSESLKGLEGPRRGWEILLQTSKSYEVAKALALRSPKCNASWQNLPLTADLRAIAVRIGSAYVAGAPSLDTFEDADRLRADRANPEQRKVSETRECGYWGNDHLAFLPLVLSYESPRELGHATVLLTLRRQEREWRLLTASRDPITTTSFISQMPKLSSLLGKSWTSDTTPSPAMLDAPEDGQFPQPPSGQRFGDFTWQPSSSVDVVAEIVEFAYENDARLFVRFPSGASRLNGQMSAGQLWTAHSPWKWRVWSLTADGNVSFSEANSFFN